MYIDAKKIGKHIYVSERDQDGHRSVNRHLPEFVFYYTDENGEYTSIDGKKLSKYTGHNFFDFRDEKQKISRHRDIYESDVDPVYRLLEQRYPGDIGPELNIQFLDIEVDKDPKRGFANIMNPYAPINAITVYNKWDHEAITLLVAPENLTQEEARDLLDGKLYQDAEGNLIDTCPEGDDFGAMTDEDGYYLVSDEPELLILFLELIEDADVLSGWNSTFFDIPYIVQRIRIVLGGENITKVTSGEDGSKEKPYEPSEQSQFYINRLNLFDCPPSLRHVEHFGTFEKVYNLHGRVHLDYLELYRKFTYEELHSYTLDFILAHEVKQTKVAYQGSLDQLYRWDFRRFTAYNRQDTMGLSAIDDKKKLIALANSMAHMAGVTLDKVLGSVVLIEQAVLKELHKQGLICFDKEEKEKDYPIPGAFVLEPQKGEYHWLSSYDFNSLYPTVIRMLNISPETIVGFVNPKQTLLELNDLIYGQGLEPASAWAHFPGTIEYRRVAEQSDEIVEFILEEDGDVIEMTGAKLNETIRENDWVITAFGLVLTRERQGIIPYCLEKWYEQRSQYKKKMKTAKNKTKTAEDKSEEARHTAEAEYYDMLQLVQKIFLNSTYGALLNQFCRFYDPRAGSSVTMSGRICLGTLAEHAEEILEKGEV